MLFATHMAFGMFSLTLTVLLKVTSITVLLRTVAEIDSGLIATKPIALCEILIRTVMLSVGKKGQDGP